VTARYSVNRAGELVPTRRSTLRAECRTCDKHLFFERQTGDGLTV
jgi:hypothetical protein